MIVVVALNPALDITHHVAGANWAGVNRPFAVHARAGGKGLNVARTLRALGQPVTLTGLAGGLTGQALLDGLNGTGILAALTPIAGETRRTFTVADSVSGQTALFNEPGPAVTEGEYHEFFVAYEKALASSQVAVFSGSLPRGVSSGTYAALIAAAAGPWGPGWPPRWPGAGPGRPRGGMPSRAGRPPLARRPPVSSPPATMTGSPRPSR